MRVRLNLSVRNNPDAALMRLAGWSAGAHVLGLVIFSILPRFTTTPPPRPTLVGEIVPASALFSPAPRAAPPRATGPSPSERAEAARKAQQEREEKARQPEPKPPAPPKPKKDPTIPPLQPKKEEKPSKKAPEPQVPPAAPDAGEPQPEPDAPEIPASPAPDAPGKGDGEDTGGLSFDTSGMEGGGVPSIGSSSFPYDYYRSSLMTLLQSNWRRPVAPGGLAEPVRCAVAFTILKTGLVKDARIAQPSGNAGLDRSALRAVIDSSPLPPLPFQYGHEAVGAVVFFELTND